MTHPDDFTVEYYKHPDGRITDFRITRGKACYRLPWWQRLLMPWRWFQYWRKPKVPFPAADPYMSNVTLLIQADGKLPTTTETP